METNLISSNKVTLKISTPQGKEMALNKGEVLQAQVQEVGEDGLVTIMVKGKPIEAYTEVAVKPGQQLLLMVDDVKNGKTYLKVVTPEIMGKIENTNISAHLSEMGITAREENIGLARKLLQYNLPVNQNNLNELNRNVSSLGGMNARNLEIAAFALSRGITGKNALESLAQFLSASGDTAKLIPVLGRLLNALAVQNPGSETANANGSVLTSQAESSKLNGSFSQLNQALNSLINNEQVNQPAITKNNNTAPAASEPAATAVDENPAPTAKLTAEAVKQSISSKTGIYPAATSESEANPVGAKEIPVTGSKAPEVVITADKPNLASGNNADQTVQPGQPFLEGEETGINPKIIPAGVKPDNSEVSARPQATVSSGAADLETKNPAPIADQGSKAAANKTINQAGNTATEDIYLQDEPPASANKMDTSAENKVKTELAARNAVITTGTKAEEEQSPGIRNTANVPADGDEVLPKPVINENGMAERMMGRETSSANKIGGIEVLPSSDTLKSEVFKLLDAVRSIMEIDLEAAPDKIAGKLQGASNLEKDIVRALNLLVDMAKNQEITKLIPELKEFSLSLDKLEKEITGQQLFNVSSRNSADMSSCYYFAFPVIIDQEYSLCQLKINKDGRKSLKDVDKINFVVSLDTSKLGMVLFHINWQKIGNLQLQGVVENQASCNYLNQNIGELVSKLEELGYQVKNLGVKVSSSAEEIQMRPVLQEVSERLRPLGIDVTV